MFRNFTTSLAAGLFCIVSLVYADPVLIKEWNWTDAQGSVHEYGVFDYSHHSWNDASNNVVDGWNLATITSQNEQQALILGLNTLQGEFWLGGYQTGARVNPANDWAWVTGEAWNYKNWAPGEPNDAHGSNSEQYLAVWSNWGSSAWLWNDEGYLPNISGYVVERSQSVPEPGTVLLFMMGLCAITVLSVTSKKRCNS